MGLFDGPPVTDAQRELVAMTDARTREWYLEAEITMLNIRISELQQLVARIVEHNDIDSDVPDYIRWEILVADARKVIEDNVADWEAHYRALGEKE